MKAPKRNHNHVFRICLSAWIAVLCFILIACGSGGSSKEDGLPHLSYTGVKTAASIREDNAEVLAINALNIGVNASAFNHIDALLEMEQMANESSQGFLFDFTLALNGTIGEIDVLTAPFQDLKAVVVSDSEVIEGSCGGINTIDIDMDTDTGVFDGSITFSNFCEDGIFFNGEADFYGVFNLMLGKLDSFTLEFDYLTIITSSDSMIMDGEIYMDVSGTITMATMNMTIQEINTGDVCKIENYQMDITDGYPYFIISINGRYYHSAYGYVDVTTTHPFHVDIDDAYPSYGVMALTGETGSAGGPTRALFNTQSDTYQLEVDADGDGEYDYK